MEQWRLNGVPCPGILAFGLRLPQEFFSRWQIMNIASFIRARVYGYHVREVGVHFDDRAHKNRQILRGVMAEYQDVRFESFRASWKMFLKESILYRYDLRIDYLPRSRTSQPLPRFDSIRSIKSSPNEWRQHVSTTEIKGGSGLRPIDCHVREH
jgi:hypothetical protein